MTNEKSNINISITFELICSFAEPYLANIVLAIGLLHVAASILNFSCVRHFTDMRKMKGLQSFLILTDLNLLQHREAASPTEQPWQS